MATKTLVSEEEFLATDFEGPEPDYVDGEVVERGMPNLDHSNAQENLLFLLRPFRSRARLFAWPELRIRTRPGHYRTGDIVVYLGNEPEGPVPHQAPFAVIEILSPDDKFAIVMAKLSEYRDMGVAHVWIVDPGTGSSSVHDNGSLIRAEAFELPEFGLRLTAGQILSRASD